MAMVASALVLPGAAGALPTAARIMCMGDSITLGVGGGGYREPLAKEILDRYGHWYIAERNPKYLRRNALVVLGNSKKQSPDIEKGIAKYLSDSDQMLKEHAEWAYDQRRTL